MYATFLPNDDRKGRLTYVRLSCYTDESGTPNDGLFNTP
ncbi:hypothetical protein MC7420_110 [Coleofasciculus chthonoplastes PCC 7420]|uniref:Uncharacterized protein n=1 Tax=Coleofasciculus chthonoplastes PCC 7420 TaxID=118168 RepID=B4W4Q7_9CYAN|nr:hypothetical protein MC7420_110 [Coleofasciculus chthonoplastes PCC 7420]